MTLAAWSGTTILIVMSASHPTFPACVCVGVGVSQTARQTSPKPTLARRNARSRARSRPLGVVDGGGME
jgi:hypothetical protein